MSTTSFLAGLGFLTSAVFFVVGLHQMRTPSTARRGNLVSAGGMVVAITATLVLAIRSDGGSAWGWGALAIGVAAGAAFGALQSRSIPMTDVPQLVSLFNAVGGGAAASVAIADFLRRVGEPSLGASSTIPIVLDVLIGGVTLSGSLVAAGKLQGIVPGRPIQFRGARELNALLALVAIVAAVVVVADPSASTLLLVLLVVALALGVLMVLPIGGADAPVVVSLLNAFTGLAVAFAGFAIDNQAMIIAGALVGAAGTILTLQMAAAMNRSVFTIMVGGFGTGDDDTSVVSGAPVTLDSVRQVTADDVGLQLAYAHRVIIVPGYGLAAAQAQHEVAQLASLLTSHGIEVSYAIHPVAGRMPGHMNVLLAEANVPYTQMLQIDEANAAFATCDVALVIGANDVTNPAARRAGNAVSGMPILDVDHAKSVVVIKRSMSPGYAGIANELFTDPRTGMLFADAKAGLTDIVAATKQYVSA